MLKQWLCDKVNDKFIESKFSQFEDEIIYAGDYPKEMFEVYYREGDIDRQLNDDMLLDEPECVRTLETYESTTQIFAPNSNLYHVSNLFKKLIDCANSDKVFVYEIDGDVIYETECSVIDPDAKLNFYAFCMNNA